VLCGLFECLSVLCVVMHVVMLGCVCCCGLLCLFVVGCRVVVCGHVLSWLWYGDVCGCSVVLCCLRIVVSVAEILLRVFLGCCE